MPIESDQGDQVKVSSEQPLSHDSESNKMNRSQSDVPTAPINDKTLAYLKLTAGTVDVAIVADELARLRAEQGKCRSGCSNEAGDPGDGFRYWSTERIRTAMQESGC